MAFETFMRQRAPVSDDPAVTIQKRGTLSLNKAAYTALGSPAAIELLYDRERNLMALRGIEEGAKSAYPLRALGRGSTWLASGKAFMNYYNLRVATAHRWLGVVEGDLLILNLNEEGTDVSLNKNQKPQQAPERPLFTS